jgi:hypothetical protein
MVYVFGVLHAVDDDRESVLLTAVRIGIMSIIQSLITSGSDIDLQNHEISTANVNADFPSLVCAFMSTPLPRRHTTTSKF